MEYNVPSGEEETFFPFIKKGEKKKKTIGAVAAAATEIARLVKRSLGN